MVKMKRHEGMRKGIAFFSTVMIMAVVSLLVTLSMDSLFFVQKSERDKRFIVQENVLLYDNYDFLGNIIAKPLKALKGLRDREEYLRSIFLLPIAIDIPGFDSSFALKLNNKEGLPNINQVSDVRFKENFLIPYLTNIKVKDPTLFCNVFLVNIGKGDSETLGDYLLDEKDGRPKTGDIKDINDFHKVLYRYIKLSEDFEAEDLDWGKLVRFNGELGLNMNYVTRKVVEAFPVAFSDYEIDDIIKHEEIYTSIQSMGIEDEDDIAKMQQINPFFNTAKLNIDLTVNLPYREVLYKFLYNVYNGKITDLRVYR